MQKPIFSFYTLGCRLNQAEEEKLRRDVIEQGFFISEPSKADICIVNTCSVTALADKKSRQAIRQLKAKNSRLKIVVTGCGSKIAKDLPEVDIIFSNKEKSKLVNRILNKYQIQNSKWQINKKLNNPKLTRNSKLDNQNFYYRTRALLKIQDGCNNFCAYCIVPFLRGREVSQPFEDLILEAKRLDDMGYQELVLTGVNVGRYGKGRTLSGETTESKNGPNLSNLIRIILRETNFPRIRLSSINPQDLSDEMINLWANEPRLCRHFHLSLQSGCNSVLKRMGRLYTAEFYKILSNKIVQKMPDIAITTDIIVGFPGETEEEFKQTLCFAEESNLAKIHVFRYSNRTGTKAARMKNQIDTLLKKERSALLQRCGKKLENKFKSRFLSKEMDVLFEYERDGSWYGLTSNYIRIKYRSKENLLNKIKKVKITKSNLL